MILGKREAAGLAWLARQAARSCRRRPPRAAGGLRPGVRGTKRVAELRVGNLTSHPRGACACGDPRPPFRVEKLVPCDDETAIAVTWSHPACGGTFEPLPCSREGFVAFFGSGQCPPAPGAAPDGETP